MAKAGGPVRCALIRCVLPFRRGRRRKLRLTPTAVGLAEAIYLERAFDRLPILADALGETGCDDAKLLAHYREAGPHARGCWPVDLVLRKS